MMRGRGLVGAVLVLVALGAGRAPTVAAHAELETSTPADGAVLDTAPDAVELVFTENVGQPAALAVLGPDGIEIPGGELEVVADTVRRRLDTVAVTPGAYTISYQVTSADGHPISGSLGFSVSAAGPATGVPAATAVAAPATAVPAATTGGAPASVVPSAAATDSTDASAVVVVALVAVLVLALVAALAATRRLIVADGDPSV